MIGPPLPPAAPRIEEILSTLIRHGVDFVLVGGQAGIARGSSYPSFDVDIAYSREGANIERLVGALRELEVQLRGAPDELPFVLDERTIANGANFTFSSRYGDLDVLGDVSGIRSYEHLRAAAERERVGDVEVPVASLDHLIAMKRASNRPKDRLMLEEYIVIADEQQRRTGA